MYKRQEITAQAHRTASREAGLGVISRDEVADRIADIVENPPDDLIDVARNASLDRTFTRPARPGTVTQGFMTFRRALNSTGLPIGHILLPFINTPANILKYVGDRTPYGYFSMRQELAKGGKEAAVTHAKIGLGTSATFLAADYAANNMITGGGPSDVQARQALERQGWQPYSFRVGDTWVRYDRLDPLGSWLAIGADFHEILANRSFDDAGDPDMFATAGRMTLSLIHI